MLLQALVPNDGVARGLDALISEMQRVARFGFTATELTRAKQARMLSYERSVTESPDRESTSRADEYTRNFLQHEALPTIWQELAFHRRFIPDITLAEINALAAQWFPAQNRLVIVTAPEATGVALPDQAQLAAVVKTASARRVDRYVDIAADQPLMEAPPARGTIAKVTPRPEAGITEWTLSNGATVVLKPTTLKEDQILFRAVGARRHLAGERRRLPVGAGRVVCRFAAGGRRPVQRPDARPDALGQGGRRVAVHRRDQRGPVGRQHAAGSRDDVPADPPAVHGAARRSHGVCRGRRRRPGGCWRTGRPARTSCSARRSTPP